MGLARTHGDLQRWGLDEAPREKYGSRGLPPASDRHGSEPSVHAGHGRGIGRRAVQANRRQVGLVKKTCVCEAKYKTKCLNCDK